MKIPILQTTLHCPNTPLLLSWVSGFCVDWVSRIYIEQEPQDYVIPIPFHNINRYPKIEKQRNGARNNNPTPILPQAPSHIPPDPTIQEVSRDILEQQAAAYVKSVRLRMITQGIPLEASRKVGEVGPSIRTSVFNIHRPPLSVPDRPTNLRPRQVKSEIDVPSKRNLLTTRPPEDGRTP
ncbi:hypothetical protein QYF36_023204 [Acer negundo]|nr:hypothetical protein QYF36_023204 [Acer negundo]